MSRNHQSFLHALLGLMLGVSVVLPLRAQLDPRLQNSKTDFLDLYQQSTTAKPKPEIATIFDCSGSMASLMYHPLYQSQDTQDADDYRSMEFQLTGGGAGTAYTNTYTITATNANCSGSTATYAVAVTSATTATGTPGTPSQGCNAAACTNAPAITITAYANGDSSAKTTLTFTPTTGANPTYTVSTTYTNTGPYTSGSEPNSYTMETSSGTNPGSTAPTITFTAWTSSAKTTAQSAPYPHGTYFVFTCYMAHQMVLEPAEQSSDENIDWSTALVTACTGASAGSISTLTNAPSPSTSDHFFTSTAAWTMPTWTASVATPLAVLAPIALASGSPAVAPGATIQLVTYFVDQGGSSANITWTTANGSNPCSGVPTAVKPVLTGGSGSTTTAGTTLASATTVSWTVPSTYCTGSSAAAPYVVTATLNVVPTADTVLMPGVTYLTAALTAVTNSNGASDPTSCLRKPDGTAVQSTDAAAASTGTMSNPAAPSLKYETNGAADVRNWIRAASHVRFTATVSGKTRTIDIPIPWKIMDAATYGTYYSGSPLNPLPSTKLLDQEAETTVVSGAPVTTYYGSQPNGGTPAIEIDSTYLVENVANGVFASNAVNTSSSGGALGAGVTTTVYLYGVVYRPAYISWLFTGTYQNTNTTWPAYTTNSTLLASTGANFVAFDAATPSLVPNQGTNKAWGQAFGPVGTSWGNITIPQYSNAGAYSGVQTVDASAVATPSLTRLQAVKKAALTTWIAHQGDVYWAFRELDPTNEANSGAATTLTNNSTTTLSAANPTTTHLNGNDSGWTVLNNTTAQGINSTTGNSVTGMTRIAYLFASGQTPLTYAVARTLAQYEDPNSVFNAVEGANVSQCSNSFLLLFTDGVDNNAANVNNTNTSTPYITGGNLSALAGNDYLIANPTSVDTSGAYWNLYTFAGMGAHLSDPSMGVSGTDYMPQWSPGTTVTSGVPHTFMPFAISQRGNTANSNLTLFSQNHRVTTMTVGVSLGGTYTNPASPKAALFYAAVAGDPSTTSGALNTFHTFTPPPATNPVWPAGGFSGVYSNPPTYPTGWVTNDWVVNPQDPGDYPTVGSRAPGAVYFFDGEYPAELESAMNYAFLIAIGTASNNATSNPDLPFVGASLGQEVYLGSFQPPVTGGVIWPGDMQMFATRTSSSGTVNFLDQNGNITTTLNSTTAQWTASSAVSARLWSARNLYTRLPATSTTEPGITPFSTSNTALLPYVATDQTNTNIVQAVIQFAAGGNTATVVAPTPPTTNRSNIMGDIIDSAPAAVPYDFSQVSGGLTSRLSAVGGTTFRLILAGDNQGWLHGFGEVTKSVTDPNGDGNSLVTGNVDELWAFMPTDFLANLDYITNNGNTHRYMVDGSPTIYFLNLPTANGGPGTGVVESNERAVAICGLGKGGRSYYALDIHNPYVPALLWSLRPDEAALFPPSRIISGGPSLATVQGILSRFGYSTATPALGRVTFQGIIHDCVFLSGGLSEPEVEANFPDPNNSSKPTPLGRSVIALDVYTGQVLAAAELNTNAQEGNFWQSGVGAIYAGVVPFEYILNSGYAQRAYFTDYAGGLWAWGSKQVSTTAPYVDFRIDSSEITSWSIRKVFQDDNTAASGLGARYSTLPAPWLDTAFPGPALTGSATPTAVGVALVSGDRNNPLDENYYTTPTPANIAPIHHDLTVVFDRQDSRALGLDTANGPDTGIKPGIGTTNLLVGLDEAPLLSTPAIPCSDPWFSVFTPGCSNYFLGTATSPKYGYYVAFPSISAAGFIPKGINPPILVANELLYSYFTPTAANPCTGGSGTTTSWSIANVMDPIVLDQRAGQFVPSGLQASWTGVASNYIAVGTTAVLQGGTVSSVNKSGVASTNPAIQNTPTQPGSKYPKVRVWRDVQ